MSKNRNRGPILDTKTKRELCVDNLFPSDVKSGTKGKNMDIATLFSNVSLNPEPDIPFTSDILLERIKKRREEKLLCYRNILKYCHQKIAAVDQDQGTDIIITMVDSIPECRDYVPRECLEYISLKLREEKFDTTILSDTMIFITWKYLELKHYTEEQQLNNDAENTENEENDNDNDND
jgi:hypothetical protein